MKILLMVFLAAAVLSAGAAAVLDASDDMAKRRASVAAVMNELNDDQLAEFVLAFISVTPGFDKDISAVAGKTASEVVALAVERGGGEFEERLKSFREAPERDRKDFVIRMREVFAPPPRPYVPAALPDSKVALNGKEGGEVFFKSLSAASAGLDDRQLIEFFTAIRLLQDAPGQGDTMDALDGRTAAEIISMARGDHKDRFERIVAGFNSRPEAERQAMVRKLRSEIALERLDRVHAMECFDRLQRIAGEFELYLAAHPGKSPTAAELDEWSRAAGRRGIADLKCGGKKFGCPIESGYVFFVEGMDMEKLLDFFPGCPIVFDFPSNHRGLGVNVAFLDGHVENISGDFSSCSDLIERIIAIRGETGAAVDFNREGAAELLAEVRARAAALDRSGSGK